MININNYYVCVNEIIYIIVCELSCYLWIWLNEIVWNGEFDMNVDNVIVMWIVYWEMMNWKWVLMNYFEMDWFVFVIENDVNLVYDELRFGILS